MNLPEGWAIVTVMIQETEAPELPESEADRQDIEWWDEFDQELGGDPEHF